MSVFTRRRKPNHLVIPGTSPLKDAVVDLERAKQRVEATAQPHLTGLDRQIAELEHDEQERAIERRLRARLADELHQLRHRRGEHQPDSWFWAITHAERTVRGQ